MSDYPRTEMVRCPRCGNIVKGTVSVPCERLPFLDCFAECDCGYYIQESEWEVVTP